MRAFVCGGKRNLEICRVYNVNVESCGRRFKQFFFAAICVTLFAAVGKNCSCCLFVAASLFFCVSVSVFVRSTNLLLCRLLLLVPCDIKTLKINSTSTTILYFKSSFLTSIWFAFDLC